MSTTYRAIYMLQLAQHNSCFMFSCCEFICHGFFFLQLQFVIVVLTAEVVVNFMLEEVNRNNVKRSEASKMSSL